MAIPEYPITRREQYLDAIATNDTSALPAEPITRTEQYLDAIARNGGGGGAGGCVLVCNVDMQTMTLDKTWQEIFDADFAVIRLVIADAAVSTMYVSLCGTTGEQFYVAAIFLSTEADTPTYMQFVATSADGYPVAQPGEG